MKTFFDRIHKVADSIYKMLTPTDEEARRMVQRYEAMYTSYLHHNSK